MNLKNGILVFSIFSVFLCSSVYSRDVELQFHDVKRKYNPDFNKLNDLGFTKIIVRAFLNSMSKGGLLFKNDHFEMAYPGFSHIVKKNKKRSFALWGWLISKNYACNKNLEIFDTKFEDGKRILVRKLDIFNPKSVKMIVSAFKSMAKLGVEGILIQDDLAFKSNEGFSKIGMEMFSKLSGVPAREKLMMESGSPYNSKWIKIKKNVISGLLREIIKGCRMINPNIKIGINVYYEASIYKKRSNEWHSQDLMEIAETGVDFIYLMMYHRQMKRELKLRTKKIKELFREGIEYAYKIAGDRLVVKMETYDWKSKMIIPISEMKKYIRLIPENIKKICFTPVKNSSLEYLSELFAASNN